MTNLPWVWFVAGSLAGSMALVAIALLWARVCRRAADRVRLMRFALVGLVAVPVVQLAGWVPEFGSGRPSAPRASTTSGLVSLAASAEPLVPAAVAVWPVAVWLGGAVGFAAYFAGRRVRLAGRLGRLPEWPEDAVGRGVTLVAARLGLRRPPAVVVGRAGCSPFVSGVFRPVLVLPPDFDRLLSPPQQEAVLAHELGHLAGRDPQWAAVGEWVAAVAWWNPLVWWLRAEHRSACEAAADEATFTLADGPGLLAESLFVLAGRMAGTRPAAAAVGGGRRSALACRVRRLLAAAPVAQPGRGRLGRAAAGVGMLCGVVAVGVTSLAAVRTAGGEPVGPSLARQWWPPRAAQPAARPPGPRTLGDLHPDLHADPRDADLAGYPLGVVTVTGNGRLSSAGEADRPATEGEAFAAAGVSAGQLEELRALEAERWAETKAMYRGPATERVSRGMQINRRWRAGLQAVLTDDQYHRYLAFWQGRPVVSVRLPR